MITVITGPPCSGKSTYARSHALPGDLIIDFDTIAQALGSTEHHDHQPWIRAITAVAWGSAVRAALEQPQGRDIWIIDSSPAPERQDSYKRARARYAHLAADEAELHRRADADGRTAAAHQAITRWQAEHKPANPPLQRRTRW